MSARDKHNELTRDFVFKVGRETTSFSEVMVVLESTILASMLLMQKAHGVAPSTCSELIESAVHRATERFTEQNGDR